MKIKDIRDLTTEELQLKVAELKKELFTQRFSLATNNLDNPMKINLIKKEIARVMTVIRERELGAE